MCGKEEESRLRKLESDLPRFFLSLAWGLWYCDECVYLRWHFFSIRLNAFSTMIRAKMREKIIVQSLILVITHFFA
jgi:hypothetical protein